LRRGINFLTIWVDYRVMAEENEDAEPSMDNILSSIRKILSEDEQPAEIAGEPSSVVAQPVTADNQPKQEVAQPVVADNQPKQELDTGAAMELSESVPNNKVSEPEKERAESALVAGSDNLVAPEAVTGALEGQSPAVSPHENNILELTQQMIAQPPSDIGAGDSILSNGPSVNSTDALQELAKALLSKRDIAIGNKDMTLEGLVREILRPLLREWLDQNLPYLIERLVKKEIDHMVNRAERLDL
jgi:cell pole-organizing protein PopZ